MKKLVHRIIEIHGHAKKCDARWIVALLFLRVGRWHRKMRQ